MADLFTITEYKSYAGITGTGDDSVLTTLAAVVSAMVRQKCDRNRTNGFNSAARTETYSGTADTAIQLKEWPVTTLTSVSEVSDDGSTNALTSTDYRLDTETGILRLLGVRLGRFNRNEWGDINSTWKPSPNFKEGVLNYSVVYTGGYSSIPDDLKLACYKVVDALFAQRRRDPTLEAESIGAYSYKRGSGDAALDIWAGVMPILQPYMSVQA